MSFSSADLRHIVENMRLNGPDLQRFEVNAAKTGLPSDLADSVSAFANLDGGTIILGLDKNSHYTPAAGFDASQTYADACELGNKLSPAPVLQIRRHAFEGSEIVVVCVAPVALDQRPCFVVRKGPHTGSYVRTPEGNRKLTNYEVNRLTEFGNPPAFDRQPVDGAALGDLDDSVLDAIVQRNRIMSPRIFGKMRRTETLVRLGIIASDKTNPGQFSPTLAGLLIAGTYPQQFFPRLDIVFSVYPDTTEERSEGNPSCCPKSQPVVGSIREMVGTSLELIKKHCGNGTETDEMPAYPLAACREAIINALQHRDYSPEGRGSWVQINLFPDRLEILSPGGLFGASSCHSIPCGITTTRNNLLSKLLECSPPVDEFAATKECGTGLQRIGQALCSAEMPEAEIKDFISAFQITFYRQDRSKTKTLRKSWGDFETTLLRELEQRGAMSVAEIIEVSGWSRNAVSTHLRNLRKNGLIEGTERSKHPKQKYRLAGQPVCALEQNQFS